MKEKELQLLSILISVIHNRDLPLSKIVKKSEKIISFINNDNPKLEDYDYLDEDD